jgi:hypothetical protein
MAKSRVQVNRSNVTRQRPPNNRDPGEVYVNWADRQIGVMDAAKNPMDFVPIRFFTETAAYENDEFVVVNDLIYRANGSVPAGTFNPSQWDAIGTILEAPTDGKFYGRGSGVWQEGVPRGEYDTTIALKAPINSPTFTGDPKSVTPTAGDNDTSVATTAFVAGAVSTSASGLQTQIDAKAPIASPTFTGDPKAPTPTAGDNDTSIATTQFVTGAIGTATTPANILTGLKTVDGAGSGLDADLLDGQNGTYYTTMANQTGTISDAQHGNRGGGALHALGTNTVEGFFRDAPSDGNTYARSNAAWVLGGGGSGGGGYTLEMTYNSGGEPPGGGQLRFDTPALPSITKMWMSETTAPGNDAAMALAYIGKKGTKCFIQDKNDSTRWTEVKLTSDSVDRGTYKEWTVDVLGNGLALTSGQRVMCYFTSTSGGASVTVADTPPNGPLNGALWFESDSGNTFIWVDDGNSQQWVQQNVMPSGTSTYTTAESDSRFVNVIGDTMSGALSVPIFYIDRPAGVGKYIQGRTDNKPRWGMRLGNETAEGSSNAGSDFTIDRYNDDGTYLGTPVSINRATGAMTISPSATVGPFSATGASDGKQITTTVINSSRTAATAVPHLQFANPNGLIGSITTNASATAYNTSSDETLKEFIGPYDPMKAIDIIRRDPVRDFTWKSSGEYAVGWGAQTSYEISPDLASPPPEPSLEEGQTKPATPQAGEEGYLPWGMDQAKRTPYLWAALAWALDEIDDLKARVTALEGGA